MLLENANDIFQKSYKRLGDLGKQRARNYLEGYGKSPKQKQLYLQSRIIELNLGSLLDHLVLDDNGNIVRPLRSTDEQINRFLATLQVFAETDKYAVAPTFFHKIKPYIINVGKPGVNGLTAKVSIESVTTGNPTDEAEVYNSGTLQNVLLNFLIPRGKNIEVQNSGTHIQWRVLGDPDWINLVSLADLTGDDGETGPGYSSITDLGLNGNGDRVIRFEGVYGAGDVTIVVPRGPTGGEGVAVTIATDLYTVTIDDINNILNLTSNNTKTITLPNAADVGPTFRVYLKEESLYSMREIFIKTQGDDRIKLGYREYDQVVSVSKGGFIGLYTDGISKWYLGALKGEVISVSKYLINHSFMIDLTD